MAIKSISIRIDSEMLDKLHYVAGFEGRSVNSQVLVLIRHCIARFEKQYGEIDFTDTPTQVAPRREKKNDK